MKKSISTDTTSSASIIQDAKDHSHRQDINFSQLLMIPQRVQFTTWLKTLSTEERYLAVQVKQADEVKRIRNCYRKIHELQAQNLWKLPSSNNKVKGFPKNIKFFVESLIFLSDDFYLDSIGFDLNLVECPERIYDILVPKNFKLSTSLHPHYSFETITTKEQWVEQTINFLRFNLLHSLQKQWDPKQLENQKNRKRQFSFFWKHLPESDKEKLLLLGSSSVSELLTLLKVSQINLQPFQVENQIKDLLKLDKNQFCNRIFKCKLKKSVSPIYDYYELIYYQWKQSIEKKKKKEGKRQNMRKRKNKRQRKKSVGAYSNETTETEGKIKNSINVHEIIEKKVEHDILQCYDSISKEVNQFLERRIIGFQRIRALIYLYHSNIKLFGSCANGIAIRNSDIDIAIDEKILSYLEYLEDPNLQLAHTLEYLHELFCSIPWIIQSKLIKSSKVPLIKLTIDTEYPVSEDYIPEYYKEILNKKIQNGGLINVDLTVQTNKHLGIISTEAINKWLEQIPTLRVIVVILKCHLASHSLNENYNRGLNTYSLIVMLVGYIYHAELVNEKSIAKVFQRVLKFYGWEFDEKTQRIDLRNKGNIFQKKKTMNTTVADLEICDPLNDGNVMTKNCYKFQEIKELLREIYKKCYSIVESQIQELEQNNKNLTQKELEAIIGDKLGENYFVRELN